MNPGQITSKADVSEDDVLKALGALSQETRLRIVRFLVQEGPDGAAAGTIAEAVDASASRLSFHLSALEGAGLVTRTRVSRSLVYSIRYEQIGGVIGYLLEDCCGNHPKILKTSGVA